METKGAASCTRGCDGIAMGAGPALAGPATAGTGSRTGGTEAGVRAGGAGSAALGLAGVGAGAGKSIGPAAAMAGGITDDTMAGGLRRPGVNPMSDRGCCGLM